MPGRRIQAMDAQRYDLTLRRMRSALSIRSKSPSELSEHSSCTSSPMPVVGAPWPDHTLAILRNDTSDSGTSSDPEGTVSSTPDFSTTSTTTSPDNSSGDSITLEGEELASKVNEVVQTDVFDREDFIITRTIIRPRPSRSFLNVFSRPPSPAQPTSGPGSSMGINFSSLNCLAASHAFEEEVDYLLAERERGNELNVRVLQERLVSREESWRQPLQELLYRGHPMPAVSGRVETH